MVTMTEQQSNAAFSLLYRVGDIPPQIFGRLDPSSLALAACVCRAWRDLARQVRHSVNASMGLFRLVVTDIFADVALLRWAVENLNGGQLPWKLQHRVCELAAHGGLLAVLKWTRENGYLQSANICSLAALGGHLEVLIWARENGCDWGLDTCAWAAGGGHLAVLRWARANGCPWDERVCSLAARGGHLQLLQWARENGCGWDESTCTRAAVGGHLALLQWARASECPWDKKLCLRATSNATIRAWIVTQPE